MYVYVCITVQEWLTTAETGFAGHLLGSYDSIINDVCSNVKCPKY